MLFIYHLSLINYHSQYLLIYTVTLLYQKKHSTVLYLMLSSPSALLVIIDTY